MAHNIFFNNQTGKHSFFSVKQNAWHGLGQVIDQYPTSAEAIQYAGLDYTVEKRPLVTGSGAYPDGSLILPELNVPDFFATVRTDTQTVLGVVGKDYHIVQNRNAFSFFDSIVNGGNDIFYETAGALGQGERIFITAKLRSCIEVGQNDPIEQYILLTTSHDGTGSIIAAYTPVRIVCNNTLNAALRNMSNVVRIRHTSSANERLTNAHKIMGIADQLGKEIEDVFNHWAKIRITDPEVKKLIQLALAPSNEVLANLKKGIDDELSSNFKNQCEKAYVYAFGSPTQCMPTTAGTLFGAYNAVTGYFQNVRDFSSGEAKLQSIMYGGGAQRKGQKAFDLCQSFAQSGALNLN